MIDARPNTSSPVTPTSNPVPMAYGAPTMSAASPTSVGGNDTGSSNTPPPKGTKKIFGMETRAVVTVLGLALFLVLAMAGVVVSLQQRLNPGTVAPNAPESQPSADVIQEATCSLSFVVAGDETAEFACNTACDTDAQCKTANGNYVCADNRCRLSSNQASESCQTTTTTYACNSECSTNEQCVSANGNYVCADNRCRLQTNVGSESCHNPDKPTYACNSQCDSNEQCAGASSSYICSNNTCRLATNVSSPNCQPDTNEVAIGCNDTCVSNGDCSNANHICFNSSCRLATNPESASCTDATGGTTVTPGVTTQPELPAELPQSGAEDWGIWLKAGLGALGIGVVLLLFL